MSQKNILTNDIIVAGLINNDRKIINNIYSTCYPSIRRHIIICGGTNDDAKEIFQEGLIFSYQKIIDNTLILNSKFSTYLYGVCRNLWFQELEYREKFMIIDVLELSQEEILKTVNDDFYLDNLEKKAEEEKEELKHMLFKKYFSKLSPSDQNILKAFIKSSIPEVAKQFNFTIDSAKTRKYSCKEKLKKMIKNDKKYKLLEIN